MLYYNLPAKGHRSKLVDVILLCSQDLLLWAWTDDSIVRLFGFQLTTDCSDIFKGWSWRVTKRSQHVDSAHRLGARGAACFHCFSRFLSKSQCKTWQVMHKDSVHSEWAHAQQHQQCCFLSFMFYCSESGGSLTARRERCWSWRAGCWVTLHHRLWWISQDMAANACSSLNVDEYRQQLNRLEY